MPAASGRPGSPSFAHGIDLQDGRKADRYISKWGLEDELTRGHTKKGRAGGETPFDLLRAVLADKEDRQAAALFLSSRSASRASGNCPGQTGLRPVSTRLKRMTRRLHPKLSKTRSCWAWPDGAAVADVLKVKARATVLELAAAGGWPSVSRFLWFIDGAAEGVQFDADMQQRRVRSSWVGWRFHKHSDRLCLSAISVGPSGYGAAPHVNLSAGSAQRKRRAVTGTLRTSMAPVAGPFFRPGRAVAARLINRYSLMHMFGMCCHRLSFPLGRACETLREKCAALARLLVATMETRFDFHYTRRIAGQFQLVIEIDTRK